MVIQLKEDLIEHLNHIQNLVDHYTKNIYQEKINTEDNKDTNTIDTTKNKEKYVIFIIHLKREVFYSFENKNKDNNYISHLSSYNQLFIDNLKGENISITQIYNLQNEILFNKNDNNDINIFDKNEEFKNIIFQGFMRFSYKLLNEYQGELKINSINYHEKATESLKNVDGKANKYLLYIQNAIIEKICEKNLNNVCYEIMTDDNYQQKGIDFISDIRNYMRELLLKFFIKFIYKSEKDAVLPSILFPINKDENEYIIQYIKNLDFGNENPSYDIRSNTVNIIFGLNLPLIYPYLFNMRNFVNSFKKDYLNYEVKQRLNNIKEEEIDKKNELIQNIKNQFNENNIFKKSNEEISKVSEEEMKIFLKDFRTIFIFENIKYGKNLEELLNIILEIKFEELLFTYDNIGEIFLWIEGYNYFIIDILKFYVELNFDLDDFKKKISEQIEDKKKNESDEEFDKINSLEPFCTIIEYLLLIVLNIQI